MIKRVGRRLVPKPIRLRIRQVLLWSDNHLTLLRVNKIMKNYEGSKLNLVGFVKFFNEGENGNLERCLRHLSRFCNNMVLCDDGSTDNSVQIAEKYTKNIITAPHDFKRELLYKQKLLDYALSLDPDWIVWLDADETFDRIAELGGIRSLCQYGDEHRVDSFSFRYYNPWKGMTAYRVDELWNVLWQPKLWKNNGRLKFHVQEGLHLTAIPTGLARCKKTDIKVLHYGFSSEELIKRKYDTYKSLGQSGRWLERIRDESGIRLKKLDMDWIPLSSLRIIVVCLIYKSTKYLHFVESSFKKHTRDAKLLFVANDATEEVLRYLSQNNIPHLTFRNPDPNEYYINRVYRAWNYGGFNAPGDILIFVNSDMAFSSNWCENLLKHLRKDRVIASRLIESGKLRSGKYGIEKDFGRTCLEFKEQEFEAYTDKVRENKLMKGGLFMPYAIYKGTFVKSGGYPEGNRTEANGRITSGDHIFFYETLASQGVKHYTSFDSIVYHIQEGEKGS